MSILLADNFSYLGRKPLDGRILYDTVAEMAAMADSTLYDGAIAYTKETNLYYSWNSENDDDPTLNKWRELEVGSSSTGVEEYDQGIDYKKGTLFIKDGQVYIAADDFTSDIAETDKEASFEADVAAGNILELEYMPIAPRTLDVTIVEAGSGYAVDEVIAADNDENLKLVIVSVDTDGAITEVAETDAPESASGTGAVIEATPELYAGSGKYWVKVTTGSGDATLTEAVTSNVTIGGIKDSDEIDKNTSFTEFVKKLLTKDIIPAITFTAGNSGLHEEGETISNSHLKVVIGNLAKVNLPINTIEFKIGAVVIDTQDFVEGTNTYTFGYSEPIVSNTTIKAVLTYDGDKTVSAEANFKFVKASYYGVVDTLTPTADEILALNKVVKESKGYTWNNANLDDARFCYAYPASMGNLTSIKDANNFEYISSYTKTTDVVDGANYNIYVLTDPVTIAGAKQVYA